MSYSKKVIEHSLKLVNVSDWWKDLLPKNEDGEIDLTNYGDLPWGDSYAADVIAEKFENLLEYEPEAEIWYVWDGIVHVPITKDYVALEVVDVFYRMYALALDYIQDELEEKAEEKDKTPGGKATAKSIRSLWEKKYKKHRALRDKLGNYDGRRTLMRDLKTKLSIPPDRYKDDTQWLVFRDGVIDCHELKRTGEMPQILPHCPSRAVFRWIDAEYGSGKDLGHWRNFLESSIEIDEVREYVQCAIGAAFSGETKLRAYLIFNGAPSSGKSLFLETLGELSGGEFGYVKSNAPSDSIIKQRSSGKNFSRALFGNKRIIGVSEPDSNAKLDGDFIKEFTGDKKVTLEAKYGQPQSVIAQGLLIIATNELPRMESSDDALFNRTKEVRFPYSFVDNPIQPNEKQKIPGLDQLLLEDRDSILRWIVEGMVKQRTLYPSLENNAPAIMNEWINEHRQDLQTPLPWMSEMISEGIINYVSNPETIDKISGRNMLKVSEAHLLYRLWMKDQGEQGHAFGVSKFSKIIMKEYGVSPYLSVHRSNGSRFPVFTPGKQFDYLLQQAKDAHI